MNTSSRTSRRSILASPTSSALQYGSTDHTYYTQVNMTRTIEQIPGLTPMNQFDLVASPMRTAFVKGEAHKDNFKPWNHVPNRIPLDQGVNRERSQPSG